MLDYEGIMRGVLHALLRVGHWMVLGYACLLAGRTVLEALALYKLEIRERLLPLENILVALTDPVLEPIRAVLRPRDPDRFDPSALFALSLFLLLDYLIAWVSAQL